MSSFKIHNSTMIDQLLNEEFIRLLEKSNLSQSEIARRIGVRPSTISQTVIKRKNLGEALFVKILRKGFGYSEKETRKIFLNAVERKYLDDADL